MIEDIRLDRFVRIPFSGFGETIYLDRQAGLCWSELPDRSVLPCAMPGCALR